MEERPYNAANEGAVKDRKLDERAYANQLRKDLAALLELPEGQRFFWHLLSEAKVFGSIYSPCHEQMYHQDGAREFGLKLFTKIEEANKAVLMRMISAHGNQQ